MSKSRGTFIMAETYLNYLNPEYLRYYFAAKLGNTPEDLDMNLEDFAQRVNSDVVGKVVNIASRCAGFINKNFDGHLGSTLEVPELITEFQEAGNEISALFENREFSKAIRLIMALADKANQYIAEQQPWVLAKENPQEERVQAICSTGLNLFRILTIYLKPVLPVIAEKVETFLQVGPLSWSDSQSLLTDHKIARFEPLMTRIEASKIEEVVDASKESLVTEEPTESKTSSANSPLGKDPISEEIEFPDFAKVDLRIVKILHAEHVEGADKLLKLTLSLGLDDSGEELTRTVFSGIKAAYAPEKLIGMNTVMVANLKPRQMKFGLSEGMILASGEGSKVFLLEPHDGADPGTRVT
jgi:methionyl-tRNA synthetase